MSLGLRPLSHQQLICRYEGQDLLVVAMEDQWTVTSVSIWQPIATQGVSRYCWNRYKRGRWEKSRLLHLDYKTRRIVEAQG
jgi:hypothetical protein